MTDHDHFDLQDEQVMARIDSIAERIAERQREVGVAQDAAVTESTRRIAAATLNVQRSPLSGAPLLTDEQAVKRIEGIYRQVESHVESFYTNSSGRRFLPLHLLFGADGSGPNTIRRIVADAVAAYQHHFSNGDGITHDCESAWNFATGNVPVAIATSRPEHRWPIRNENTFESVARIIKHDVHCDLDLFADTELRSCIDRQKVVAEGYGRVNGDADRRRYIEASFSTVPFAHGDLLVFARICAGCWDLFLHRNQIDPSTCEILKPWSDGFGSVENGPITPTE
jgi:hypothetical protein